MQLDVSYDNSQKMTKQQRTLHYIFTFTLFIITTTNSQKRTISRTFIDATNSFDTITEYNVFGNVTRNENCTVDQIALLSSTNKLQCESKNNILEKIGSECKIGGDQPISLFPFQCNDTTNATLTRLLPDELTTSDEKLPIDCLNLRQSPQQANNVLLEVKCKNRSLDVGSMYKVSMRCQPFYSKQSIGNVCVLVSSTGQVKDRKMLASTPSTDISTTLVIRTYPTVVTQTNSSTWSLSTTVSSPRVTIATVHSTKNEGGVTIGLQVSDTPPIKSDSIFHSVNASAITTTMKPTLSHQSNTTHAPLTPNNKTNNVLIYVIISSTVVLIILLSCLAYFCCCRNRKILQEKPSDMESLYAKPQKLKKKNNLVKTSYFGSGYDEVGALIPGVYEERNDENEDPNLFIDHDNSSTENLPLKLLAPASTTITDDPYEIIGRSNSFTPKRPPKHSQEDITKDNDSKISVETGDNTPTIKPNGSIRLKQNRTSVRKGKFQENNALSIHEDVTITPPISALSSTVNIPNILVVEPEGQLDKLNERLKNMEGSNDKLSSIPDNISIKSNSYEEIWNMGPTLGDSKDIEVRKNTDGDEDSPYERIPSTSNDVVNKPVKENSAHALDTTKEHVDPDDSGYEEIWSGKKVDQKTENNNVENNAENESNTSSLNYPEVEIKQKEYNEHRGEPTLKTDYIDVVVD